MPTHVNVAKEPEHPTPPVQFTRRIWWINMGADCGVLHPMSVRLKCSFSGPLPQSSSMHDCHPQGIVTILRAPVYRFLNNFKLAIIVAGIHSSHTIKCQDTKAGI